ncbi:MAG: deoxycytidine triphosphate deaminase [Patescibacteria group bacterium]|nr:deoxycytidine triphosphate deaminase [Patescibacteria group bacterium]
MEIQTGVFSDKDILSAISTGLIVIDPFDIKLLNTTSYDCTLGEWYYVFREDGYHVDYNPYDPEDVDRSFTGPFRAVVHKDWADKYRNGKLWKNIPAEARIIVLRPGENIICHTAEFIGTTTRGTTMMHAKSTVGRNNLSVCDDAGWGDIGYFNRWAQETRNKTNKYIPLVVGEAYSQIIFFHTGETDRCYGSEGTYQDGSDLEVIKASWKPEMLLPVMKVKRFT